VDLVAGRRYGLKEINRCGAAGAPPAGIPAAIDGWVPVIASSAHIEALASTG
jgi:hypothetical protein